MTNSQNGLLRPVRYVRVDLPADGGRCTGYLWQSDRTFRVGSAVTGVPGWGRVVVVADPVTRHGVEHVQVAARGWAAAGEGAAVR
jgi:hypothetical protein